MYGPNDFIFDGMPCSDLFEVEEIRRPAINVTTETVKGLTDGSHHVRTQYEAYHLEVDIVLFKDNVQNLQSFKRQMIGRLFKRTPRSLILRDEPDKLVYASLDGPHDFERIWYVGRATLRLLVPDGLAYAVEETTGASGTNNGTVPVKPVLTFTASAETHTITNGSQTLYFANLTAGDVVIIDCKTGHISVNGASGADRESLSSRSDLFVIPVGAWSITGATATFREAFL